MGYESVWAFGMLLKIDNKIDENSENETLSLIRFLHTGILYQVGNLKNIWGKREYYGLGPSK